jgi:dihydroflavonol-4-reductase
MSKVAITGASGLLGGNLAALLCADGHTVVATRRAGTQVAHLADLPIEWRDADLGSPSALTQAFAGVDAVFHCAAAVGVSKDVTPALVSANVDGTRHVLEAVAAAKVPRLIHTSSTVAIGLSTNGQPVDENARWNFDDFKLADGYSITKRQSEELVRASAIDHVVVNPGYMFGARDARPSSGKMIVDIAKRRSPGWTPGKNNFAAVKDVARGLILAWQKGRRGERYIMGGHNLSYGDIFKLIAKVAGVAPPRFRVPYAVVVLIGRYGDFIESRGKDPLVNSVQARYAFTQRFQFTSDKAVRELGYSISPLEPAITEAIDWFRANKML